MHGCVLAIRRHTRCDGNDGLTTSGVGRGGRNTEWVVERATDLAGSFAVPSCTEGPSPATTVSCTRRANVAELLWRGTCGSIALLQRTAIALSAAGSRPGRLRVAHAQPLSCGWHWRPSSQAESGIFGPRALGVEPGRGVGRPWRGLMQARVSMHAARGWMHTWRWLKPLADVLASAADRAPQHSAPLCQGQGWHPPVSRDWWN